MKTRQTGEGLLAIAGFLFSIGGLVLTGCATVRLGGAGPGARRGLSAHGRLLRRAHDRGTPPGGGGLPRRPRRAPNRPGGIPRRRPVGERPRGPGRPIGGQGYDSLLVLGLHPFVHREEDADWRSVFRAGADGLAFQHRGDRGGAGGRRYVGGHVWLMDLKTGRAVWSGHGTLGVPADAGPRRTPKAAARAVVRRLVEEKFLPEAR
jgi:hypothetical protein